MVSLVGDSIGCHSSVLNFDTMNCANGDKGVVDLFVDMKNDYAVSKQT